MSTTTLLPESSEFKPLTRYVPGSLRELWTVTYPMIVSMLSGSLMFFIDGIILARYDINVMNAVMAAGMTVYAPVMFAVNIAAISEIFVGQHNGAGRYKRLGEPVWQMIFFALISLVFFVPFGLLTSDMFLSELYKVHGRDYYHIMMTAAPLQIITVALSSFFIGQGKTKIVSWSMIVGNIINVILVFALVFGVKGWIPSLGAVGAAIATCIAQLSVVIQLFVVFLNKKNREEFGTNRAALRPKVFWECLKIGFPNAISHSLEIAAWALLLNLLAEVGPDYVTVYNIGRFFLVPFFCLLEGTQKGVIAVVSNFVGMERWDLVKKTIGATARLIGVMALALTIPLFIFPEQLIQWFLADALAQSQAPEILTWVRLALIGVWLYFLFDGLTWSFAGVLTSGGDTKFIMLSNVVNSWLFCILPVYIFVVKMCIPAYATWMLASIYAVMNAIVLGYRYKQGHWKVKRVH